MPFFKLLFFLILSSPAFQRPEDNGTPHDAIVLLLSLVGGDLKFCFKTATVPILLNPPILLLPLSPPSSWVYYLTLLNFSQSYWRPGVHWGVSYTAESETEIDRDLAACYSTTLSGNKKSFCSFLCYNREIKLGITHTHKYFLCTHTHTIYLCIYVCVCVCSETHTILEMHTTKLEISDTWIQDGTKWRHNIETKLHYLTHKLHLLKCSKVFWICNTNSHRQSEPKDKRREKETSLACKRLKNLIWIRGRFPQRSMYSADVLRGRKFNTPFLVELINYNIRLALGAPFFSD